MSFVPAVKVGADGCSAEVVVEHLPEGLRASEVQVHLVGSCTLELTLATQPAVSVTLPFPVHEEGCRVKLHKGPHRRICVTLKRIDNAKEANLRGQAETTFVHQERRVQDSIDVAAPVLQRGGELGNVQAVAIGRGRGPAVSSAVATSLDERSWALVDDFLPLEQVEAVRNEILQLKAAGLYKPGRIGTQRQFQGQHQIQAVRGDEVLWLDAIGRSASPQLSALIDAIDTFVFEGLKGKASRLVDLEGRTDTMLACYPGQGSRYAKHVDNTSQDGRRLSVVCYLNPGWEPAHGGALHLHPMATHLLAAARGKTTVHASAPSDQEGVSILEVQPVAGRLVLFYADTVLHEVAAAKRERHALTMWFYDGPERQRALRTMAATQGPGSTEPLSTESKDMEAVLLQVMGVLQSMLTEEHPNQAALQRFVSRVRALSARAQEIMAWLLDMQDSDALMAKLDNITLDTYKVFLAGAAKAASKGAFL